MKWTLILLLSISVLFGQINTNNYTKKKIAKLEKIFEDHQRQFEHGTITLEKLITWNNRLYKAKYKGIKNLNKKLTLHTQELDFYKEIYEIIEPNIDSFQAVDLLIVDLAIFEAYNAYEETFNEYNNVSSKKQPKYENLTQKMQKILKKLSIQYN